jgi:hypothetical protein
LKSSFSNNRRHKLRSLILSLLGVGLLVSDANSSANAGLGPEPLAEVTQAAAVNQPAVVKFAPEPFPRTENYLDPKDFRHITHWPPQIVARIINLTGDYRLLQTCRWISELPFLGTITLPIKYLKSPEWKAVQQGRNPYADADKINHLDLFYLTRDELVSLGFDHAKYSRSSNKCRILSPNTLLDKVFPNVRYFTLPETDRSLGHLWLENFPAPVVAAAPVVAVAPDVAAAPVVVVAPVVAVTVEGRYRIIGCFKEVRQLLYMVRNRPHATAARHILEPYLEDGAVMKAIWAVENKLQQQLSYDKADIHSFQKRVEAVVNFCHLIRDLYAGPWQDRARPRNARKLPVPMPPIEQLVQAPWHELLNCRKLTIVNKHVLLQMFLKSEFQDKAKVLVRLCTLVEAVKIRQQKRKKNQKGTPISLDYEHAFTAIQDNLMGLNDQDFEDFVAHLVTHKTDLNLMLSKDRPNLVKDVLQAFRNSAVVRYSRGVGL